MSCMQQYPRFCQTEKRPHRAISSTLQKFNTSFSKCLNSLAHIGSLCTLYTTHFMEKRRKLSMIMRPTVISCTKMTQLKHEPTADLGIVPMNCHCDTCFHIMAQAIVFCPLFQNIYSSDIDHPWIFEQAWSTTTDFLFWDITHIILYSSVLIRRDPVTANSSDSI